MTLALTHKKQKVQQYKQSGQVSKHWHMNCKDTNENHDCEITGYQTPKLWLFIPKEASQPVHMLKNMNITGHLRQLYNQIKLINRKQDQKSRTTMPKHSRPGPYRQLTKQSVFELCIQGCSGCPHHPPPNNSLSINPLYTAYLRPLTGIYHNPTSLPCQQTQSWIVN